MKYDIYRSMKKTAYDEGLRGVETGDFRRFCWVLVIAFALIAGAFWQWMVYCDSVTRKPDVGQEYR